MKLQISHEKANIKIHIKPEPKNLRIGDNKIRILGKFKYLFTYFLDKKTKPACFTEIELDMKEIGITQKVLKKHRHFEEIIQSQIYKTDQS